MHYNNHYESYKPLWIIIIHYDELWCKIPSLDRSIPGQSVSLVLQIFFWTLSRSLWLEPLPLHGWEAAGNASREMLCVSTLLHEKKKKTGTQLLNKLLLSTLFRLHITCVAAGEIVMCGVLSCPTRGTPKLLVAPPLKNNSTFPLIPPALQRNDWVLITPYLLFLIRKCPKGTYWYILSYVW